MSDRLAGHLHSGIPGNLELLKVTTSQPGTGRWNIHLVGQLTSADLQTVDDAISEPERLKTGISLDLKGLTLVDRIAMEYLSRLSKRGCELTNCPPYVARWMAQEDEPGSRIREEFTRTSRS